MWRAVTAETPINVPLVVVTAGNRTLVAIRAPFDGGTLTWQAHVEDEHPRCWTDGVCWNENADGERSDHPKWWAPMPDGWDQ